MAGGLIFLEFLPLPRALVDTRIPSFYQQIREEGRWNDFAVLEMPDSVTTYSMYYQTEHHHPILNAYLSRNPEYPFEQNPGIRELRTLRLETLRRDILDRSSYANIPAVLASYHIRYVILHPGFLKEDETARAQEVLEAAFGNQPPYFQDSALKAWRVESPDQGAPAASKVLVTFGSGWKDREIGPSNEIRRSANSGAWLNLANPFSATLSLQVSVPVSSAGPSRRLQVLLDEKPVKDEVIENTQRLISFNIELGPGNHRLSFKSPGPEEGKTGLVFGPFSFT